MATVDLNGGSFVTKYMMERNKIVQKIPEDSTRSKGLASGVLPREVGSWNRATQQKVCLIRPFPVMDSVMSPWALYLVWSLKSSVGGWKRKMLYSHGGCFTHKGHSVMPGDIVMCPSVVGGH